MTRRQENDQSIENAVPADPEKIHEAAKRIELPKLTTSLDLSKMEFPEPEWIVEGIIPEDGMTILAGKPKIGKSWLVLQLAGAVSCGGVMLGNIKVKKRGVLYLALEDNERRLQDRMEKLQIFPSNLFYYRCNSHKWPRGKESRSLLKTYLDEYPDIKLVIIDTLYRVRGGASFSSNQYEVDYAEVNLIKEIADEHGISIIVLHHTNKRLSNDPLEMISGTNGLAGSADTLLVLTRTRGEMDAELYIEGRDVEQRDLALKLDIAGGIGWELIGDAETYRQSKVERKIQEEMREAGEAITLKYLSDVIDGESYANIQHAIRRMQKEGLVMKSGYGKYLLTIINNE